MNEKPVLFSGPMVKAILSGAKTVTRRVVNPDIAPQPDSSMPAEMMPEIEEAIKGDIAAHGCPYGKPGDRLWLRETWADVTGAFQSHDCEDVQVVAFRADEAVYSSPGMKFLEHMQDSGIVAEKWRPSIFMPRYLSRITLEIVSVSVERLQEISDDDVMREGEMLHIPKCQYFGTHQYGAKRVYAPGGVLADGGDICNCGDYSFREIFALCWDHINGKRPGCSWRDSPWVWAIGFKRAASALDVPATQGITTAP